MLATDLPPIDDAWAERLGEDDRQAWARFESWLAAHPETTALYAAMGADASAVASALRDRLAAALQALATHPALAHLSRGQHAGMFLKLWSWLFPETPAATPFIQGLLGVQGTGKTTLGAAWQALYPGVLSLSLDDYYLTLAEREALRARHPAYRFRGPPGTHDVALAQRHLKTLRAGGRCTVARFDKSLHDGAGDRVPGEQVSGVSAVLFEGWCVGLRPLDTNCLDASELPELAGEADRDFAHHCNAVLAEYTPLWSLFDALWVLKPDDYRHSLRWRQEAESRLRASGRDGMQPEEVEDFVRYFWCALHPALHLAPEHLATLLPTPSVIEVDGQRQPYRVWRPQA